MKILCLCIVSIFLFGCTTMKGIEFDSANPSTIGSYVKVGDIVNIVTKENKELTRLMVKGVTKDYLQVTDATIPFSEISNLEVVKQNGVGTVILILILLLGFTDFL